MEQRFWKERSAVANGLLVSKGGPSGRVAKYGCHAASMVSERAFSCSTVAVFSLEVRKKWNRRRWLSLGRQEKRSRHDFSASLVSSLRDQGEDKTVCVKFTIAAEKHCFSSQDR